ncbi:VC2046/SO_2500 family protein [Lacimicrobium sp. SS2-24]|uniref:VC2046/SO_2500 family protein n=1 Tax=Lacimicrobium sp. SS2-24 TaxID=2005569 RepID=UPI000B4A625A|nr:VC2046/SO_2500 family protein [Lacimicrobium sp. SS2-24]
MQPVVLDFELNSSLSKAASQGNGANFALLLAMLQDNLLDRPRLEASKEQHWAESQSHLDKAPEIPLKAETQHWEFEAQHAQYVNQQQLASARLWHCLHPSPLSVFNDNKRLDDEVVENTSWSCRQKLKGGSVEPLQVDETNLLEVIDKARQYQAA